MLKIRMQRTGRINIPSYRVVVVERARSAKTGNFVERLGSYDPKSKVRTLDAERVKYWLSVGAQPSGTVHNMLISAGIILGKKVNVLPRKSPPKKEEPAAEKPAAQAPAPEVAKEEPVAEAPTASTEEVPATE